MRGTWKSYFEITGFHEFTWILKGVWDSSSPMPQLQLSGEGADLLYKRMNALAFCLNVVVSSYSALPMSGSDIPVSQYSSKTLRFPLSF